VGNPLGKWRDTIAPSCGGFREFDGKRCHQPAVAVTLLEKPLTMQWSAYNPVEYKSIDLWSNRLHQITCQAITRWCVNVQDTYAGVKSECRQSQAGFRFE